MYSYNTCCRVTAACASCDGPCCRRNRYAASASCTWKTTGKIRILGKLGSIFNPQTTKNKTIFGKLGLNFHPLWRSVVQEDLVRGKPFVHLENKRENILPLNLLWRSLLQRSYMHAYVCISMYARERGMPSPALGIIRYMAMRDHGGPGTRQAPYAPRKQQRT